MWELQLSSKECPDNFRLHVHDKHPQSQYTPAASADITYGVQASVWSCS